IFVLVRSCACTSRPITASYFASTSGEMVVSAAVFTLIPAIISPASTRTESAPSLSCDHTVGIGIFTQPQRGHQPLRKRKSAKKNSSIERFARKRVPEERHCCGEAGRQSLQCLWIKSAQRPDCKIRHTKKLQRSQQYRSSDSRHRPVFYQPAANRHANRKTDVHHD